MLLHKLASQWGLSADSRCGAGDELDAVVALHDLVVLGGLGLQLPIDAVHVFRVEQPALHIHEGPEGAPPPRIDTGIE